LRGKKPREAEKQIISPRQEEHITTSSPLDGEDGAETCLVFLLLLFSFFFFLLFIFFFAFCSFGEEIKTTKEKMYTHTKKKPQRK